MPLEVWPLRNNRRTTTTLHYETLQGGTEGWGTLIGWHGFGSEGALQVHVDAQHSGQQLPLVLVETHEGVEDRRAAAVHPGGKQAAGGADVGREGVVVVELQLTREPVAISISSTMKEVASL